MDCTLQGYASSQAYTYIVAQLATVSKLHLSELRRLCGADLQCDQPEVVLIR